MKKPATHRGDGLRGTVSMAMACTKLGIAEDELRRLLGAGEMAFVQVRGRIRVSEESLAAWQTKREAAADPA